MLTQYIWITMQTEFIHKYKDAPEEVSFLRYPHRHVAHIKVQLQVFHSDREIEFIMFKRELQSTVDLSTLTNCSCEQIAQSIIDYIKENYGSEREITVDVAEDGENGCKVVYTPTSKRIL